MTQHLSGSLVAPWEEGPDENHYPLPGVLPLGKSPSSRAELRTRRPSFYVGAGGGGAGNPKVKPQKNVGGGAGDFTPPPPPPPPQEATSASPEL